MLRGGDVAAEALDSGIAQVAGPSIDWLALLPMIILLVGALLIAYGLRQASNLSAFIVILVQTFSPQRTLSRLQR